METQSVDPLLQYLLFPRLTMTVDFAANVQQSQDSLDHGQAWALLA